MADIDNFNRTWQGLTHGEVEDAIKAKAAAMDAAIEEASESGYAPPEDGIPKEDLAQDVQDALDYAHIVMGSFDNDGHFHEVTQIVPLGGNQYASDYIENPSTDVVYIDIQHATLYRYDTHEWVPLAKIPIDGGIISGSNNPVKGGVIHTALEGKQSKIEDVAEFIGEAVRDIVGNVATLDDSQHIPYGKIPKVALESMDHTHVDSAQGDTSLIGNAYFCPSENKLRYYFSARKSVAYSPEKGLIYYDKETKHFYTWDGSRMQRIGINIAVVGPNDSVPEGVDLCFFVADTSNSGGGTTPVDPITPGGDEPPVDPDPGVHTIVGENFNALLAGNDTGATFSPGKLYALSGAVNNTDTNAPEYSYEDAEIDLEDEDVPIAVDDNEVFFNRDDGESVEAVRTPMKYYGDIVVSNTVKMADTADTAYLSFMVAHPFFADETDVLFTFDMSEVSVSYKRIGTDYFWEGIASGMAISFANTDDATEIQLIVSRINSGFTTTGMKSTITLNNGHTDTDIDIIFNPAKVLFKNGETGNGFSIQSANQITLPAPFDDGHGVSRLSYDDNGMSLVAGSGRYCPIKQGVQLDMSKFNVLYAVLSEKGNTWTEILVYDDNWEGAWVESGGNRVPRHKCTGSPDYDSCIYNAYQRSGTLADTTLRKDEFAAWKERVGSYVLSCFVHTERLADAGNRTFDLYLAKDGGELKIIEIGIITYDTSLL